jgi:ergothioneine biosynthesis protein EgtB
MTGPHPSSAREGTEVPRPDPADPLSRYRRVRAFTEALTRGLAPEDMVVQSMPDVSPTKWHLAHTTWFFEVFVLQAHLAGYEPLDSNYHYLFNSYYVGAGERHCRDQRGYLSRPTVREILDYRRHVDEAMDRFLGGPGSADPRARDLVELGINHEQQHQELLLTDLKHVFSVNPLRPAYLESVPEATSPGGNGGPPEVPLRWISVPEGLREVGWAGAGFAYDNEGPRHRRFLDAFQIADRLVTNGEYLAFMEDGGYRTPLLWMSEGWATVQELGWSEPYYWERREGEWWIFTLWGMRRLDPREPVCHLTWFEADAYARWAGGRLPREEEWEVAVSGLPIVGNLADSGRFHPAPLAAQEPPLDPEEPGGPRMHQAYGDVWEWTGSPYSPYPGFRPAAGSVGEYNGKFMCNQFVLRGGSATTSGSHLRPTYRNFFPPQAAWQLTGLRLARDAS